MNTPAADDYSAIKARMEEIEREKANAGDGGTVLIEDGSDLSRPPKTYMGWDIYPPVNITIG